MKITEITSTQKKLHFACIKMAFLHEKEMILCKKYLDVFIRENDKIMAKDFAKLVKEHNNAFIYYMNLSFSKY